MDEFISCIKIGNDEYLIADGTSTVISDNLVPNDNGNTVRLSWQPGMHLYKLQIYYSTTLYDTSAGTNKNKGKIGGSSVDWKLYDQDLGEIYLYHPIGNNDVFSASLIDHLAIPIIIRLQDSTGRVYFERLGGAKTLSTSTTVKIRGSLFWLGD